MALAQKTRQLGKNLATKAAKPAVKMGKSGKKLPPTKPKPKSAAEQPVAVASTQLIEKAKAALKRENVGAEVAKAKPMSKAKARRISIEASANEAASALIAKWTALFKKADQIEAKPYNMKAIFEEKTAIVHKLLGWGYILANRNDRLEVLFKDGIKHLISNYKP